MSTLVVSGKAIGAKRPLFADWSIPFPPDWSDAGGVTLRDLIDRVVRSEVQAFRQRQADRQQMLESLVHVTRQLGVTTLSLTPTARKGDTTISVAKPDSLTERIGKR